MGGGQINASNPAAASLQIQTSNYGRVIPIVYGTNRIAGNLIWYSDFKSTPITSSSGGKGGTPSSVTGYNYQVAAIIGLSEGPLSSITEKTAKEWSYRGYPGLTTHTYTGIRTIFANQAKYTPAQLSLTVATGTAGQTAFSYVTTNHPTEALNYKYLATVAASAYNLGTSPSMPQQLFEIVGVLANVGATGIYDARPYDIAVDLLTNPVYGAGFPSSMLSDATGNYLYAAGLWFSPAYSAPSAAADHIKNLARLANCEWVWSGGVLKLVPYGLDSITGGPGVTLAQGSTALGTLTYTPGSLAVPVYALTDDDFQENGTDDPVLVQRGTQASAFNQVQVKYTNRFNDYADSISEAKDLASIEAYGLLPMPVVDAPEICDPNVARTVAQLLLQRSQYIRNTYKFTLSYRFILLDPMDLVTLTESTESGLNGQVVRITSITENANGTLDIEAEDVVGNVTTVAQYAEQLPAGYLGNYNTDAGDAAVPVIFDAPGRMTAAGYEIWIAAAGLAANPWGGAYVWISLDGTTYKQVGTIAGAARYGSLTSSVIAGTDPDTVRTFPVDLTISGGSLAAGSTTDADNANTLCWLDGELISYSAATLTSANHYTIQTYTRRGVYGTPNAAHSSGAKFVRLDTGVFKYAYDAALVGKTVYVKLQSFNTWQGGVQSLAAVTAYTYTIAGPIGAPSNVTGVSATVTTGGTVQLAWTAVSTPDLAQYEIRQGSTWSSATFVGRSLTTSYTVAAPSVGSTTWLVRAMNSAGAYSVGDGSATLSISAPSAPSVTAQVVDNNVLLYWNAISGSLPTDTYQIRRGATFAGATIIGTKSGLFTALFETAAGTYTYWVAAIDTAGNVGSGGSVTAVVNQPPDYVLKSNTLSTFGGTFVAAIKDPSNGALVLPVDITTQYQTHFTTPGWAGPSAQVSASFPLFIEKAAASGSYEEFIDTGATIAAAKITASWAEVDTGTPAIVCTISTSPDNVTYTPVVASAIYVTTFRYVKVKLSATSAGGADLAVVTNFNIRIDAKLKNDAGSASAVSTDTNGTTVTFTTSFTAITSITATPQLASGTGATTSTAVVIFAGGANPTTFAVMLFNQAGTRISGTVNWTAKGY